MASMYELSRDYSISYAFWAWIAEISWDIGFPGHELVERFAEDRQNAVSMKRYGKNVYFRANQKESL